MPLDTKTDIKSLYGVGPAKARAYARLGISTVGDLLCHYPRRYENRGDVRLLCDAEPCEKCAVLLTVATEPKVSVLKGRLSLLKFRAYDDSGICEIIYFNQNFLKSVFTPGTQFRFFGKIEKKGKNYSMSSPVYEAYFEGTELPPLVPVYPLAEGLSQKQLAKDMATVFGAADPRDIGDPLPENIRRANSLCTLSYAVKNIHRPDDFVSLAKAKKRLIFDEFFTFALGLSLSKSQNSLSKAYPCPDTDVSPLLSLLPYEITNAQRRTIDDVRADMAKETAMSRIIVGDVGCGKTVCAAAAIYMAVKNGKQAALMVPTEILAIQHYNDLSALLSKLGIRCELLTSSVKKAKKSEIYASLASSDKSARTDVVIGTQALLTDGVSFSELGLIVTDEQHRFGVNQRALLSERNRTSHVLVMSATPIPRSMALALYGDLALSLIDEMPSGRDRVDTFVVNESYRDRLNEFIRKQINGGGQVYVVCPAVTASEEDDEGDLELSDVDDDGNVSKKAPMKATIQFSEVIAKTFSEFRVEYLHGKMKPAEKEAVMLKFARGDIDILVSTTVIEVGVNVPNASLMIVENAERFGLSQLHQLRGRVGRGSRKSFCVLVSEADGSSASERLRIMKTTYDGYEIAEKDLEMRGPGDFLRASESEDIRQSGGVRFKLAQLCDDTGLLNTAFAEANSLIASDPKLSLHPELRSSVTKMFSPDRSVLN
ncbi:MAG: ATP-dependent DNA helicase RecG [Clostridia bacterium]|nr:ATP-dependent DNA helicase RecG [Clostridia bacterium]